jgi:hypothetical protein
MKESILFRDGILPAVIPFSFSTSQPKTIRSITAIEGSVDTLSGLSVSSGGRWILYGQFDQVGTDLMLVENFR